MTAASVGFHCPECVKRAAKTSPTITARSLANRVPVVTYTLIAANVLAFLAQLSTGGALDDTSHSTVYARFITTPYTVVFHGFVPTLERGEWYRAITGGFLHLNLLHLAGNMLVLWLIGTQMERVLGPARYVALYFVSLVAASFAVLLMGDAGLGASGAIFGLLGAAAAYQRINRINMLQSGLAMLIVLMLAMSFVPGVSVAAHVGGLVAGAAAGWAMFELERRRTPEWLVVTGAAVVAVLLVAGGLVAAQQLITTGHAVL